VQLLQAVDEIVVINRDGEIIDHGTYAEVAGRNSIGENDMASEARSPAKRELSDEEEEEVNLGEYQTELHTRIDDLRRQKGDWASYALYIRSMGWLNFYLFVLGAVFYVVFYAIFQIWVTWWAGDTSGTHGLGYWLGLYSTWAVLITLTLLCTPL